MSSSSNYHFGLCVHLHVNGCQQRRTLPADGCWASQRTSLAMQHQCDSNLLLLLLMMMMMMMMMMMSNLLL
jgi:hypothetical protein